MDFERYLAESGAFADLDNPEILVSGELSPFYINLLRLLEDGGTAERRLNADDMIRHACNVARTHGKFGLLIDALTRQVGEAIGLDENAAISGGERKDWIFSGPVSRRLHLPHITLYKNTKSTGPVEVAWPGCPPDEEDEIDDLTVYHIADLLTKGSSVYRIEEGEHRGWIPMLRGRKARAQSLHAVVDRMQGARERLAAHGIRTASLIDIDEGFFRRNARHPERDIAYWHNSQAWGEEYLREHGALGLAEYFDPNGRKQDRARRFLDKYASALEGGPIEELERAVKKRYGAGLR